MVDAAKYADLVLLLIDAAFGFEMETFEFLNLLQVREPDTPRNLYKNTLEGREEVVVSPKPSP